MSFVAALLAPLVMLMPLPKVGQASGQAERERVAVEAPAGGLALPAEASFPAFDELDAGIFQQIVQSFQAQGQNQLRIEQRVTIRIAPRAAPPPQANMMMDLPQRPLPPRMTERDMGRCLAVAGIAGVQVGHGNRLILFMRDRRVISAALERSCSARDYYSGFYVEQNTDGQICVRRDSLLSRSGANCKLTQLRQLVDAGN
jgi:hypothetical protein